MGTGVIVLYVRIWTTCPAKKYSVKSIYAFFFILENLIVIFKNTSLCKKNSRGFQFFCVENAFKTLSKNLL
jgi:hypothetical protein